MIKKGNGFSSEEPFFCVKDSCAHVGAVRATVGFAPSVRTWSGIGMLTAVNEQRMADIG